MKGILAALILCWSLPLIAETGSTLQEAPHISVRLLTETRSISAGQSFWALVFFSPEPHWHTYWKNPGDSGLAPELNWQLPAGWQVESPLFETPSAIPYGSEINYGYEGDSGLLIKLTPPASLPDATVTLKLNARWLVCADACVPGKADLALKLPVSNTPDQPTSKQFQQSRQRLPTPVNRQGYYHVTDETVEIMVPHGNINGKNLQVFIAPNHVAATQPEATISKEASTLRITAPRHQYYTQAPELIEVVIRNADKAWTYRAQLQPDTSIPQQEATP